MGSIAPINDILIIGTGLSGVNSLCQLRKRFPTWSIKALEAGSDVGGTWYWNRYPGCRIDTQSASYGYSFDKELLEEWHWKETFCLQSETLSYIQRVAHKHDVYKDVQFNTRVKSAQWNDDHRIWTFTDEGGNEYMTRFFVSCLGFLSSPTLPNIPGVEDFQGQSFHTSRWPKDIRLDQDFTGKRIGVIGTGATGIQTVTAISQEPSIKSLVVFQRTANWTAPLNNTKISPDEMNEIRHGYDAMFQHCAETPTWFIQNADPRKSAEQYLKPGFAKWLGVFSDTYTDRHANKLYSDFIADKIRQRVHDPAIVEKMVPKDHGFALNKDHVNLVDLKQTPIKKITSTGIVTSDGNEHPLDIIIYATGFDAITGAFNAIEWSAKDGRPLIAQSDTKEGRNAIWPDHRPRTFLGMTIPAMPNTFMILGPHQPFGNATRSIEHAVEVISDLLQYCKDHGYSYVEPTQEAVDEWTAHVNDCSKGALVNEVDSWMTGVNTNVKGKTVRSVARYSGSAIAFRQRCVDCKTSGYNGLVFA